MDVEEGSGVLKYATSRAGTRGRLYRHSAGLTKRISRRRSYPLTTRMPVVWYDSLTVDELTKLQRLLPVGQSYVHRELWLPLGSHGYSYRDITSSR